MTGVPERRSGRRRCLLADASPSRGGAGAYVLTGRGVEQHTDGTDTVTAAIDLALALGLPGRAGLRLRLPDRAGQRPGRPRARAEVRPAARLPQHRRPGRARARRRRLGRRPRAASPGPGCPPSSCSAAAAATVRALLVHGSNLVVSAPDATAVTPPAARRSTCSSSATSCPARPRGSPTSCSRCTQWAEEEGTMTNLEGRVLRRRKALDPPPGVRSELDVLADLAGPARRAGAVRHRARARSSTSWPGPAPAAAPTTPGCRTRGSTPARPCTGRARRRPPRHPADVPRPLRHADGRARVVPVHAGPPADDLRADARVLPGHRPACSRSTSPAPRPAASPR